MIDCDWVVVRVGMLKMWSGFVMGGGYVIFFRYVLLWVK